MSINQIMLPFSEKFSCEKCNYYTSKKSSYAKHIESIKHKNNALTTKSNFYMPGDLSKHYQCKNCDKIYNDRAGLWRHKKKCENNNNTNKPSQDDMNMNFKQDDNMLINGMFMDLMKQNQEFQKLIMEQNKQIIELSKEKSITNNCSINNSNNKTFNLQVFLNEKCKDALNINEFIDSLKISLSDLENIGEKGFVDGISKIFVNGLKSLDIYKRPIHCSDLKRETMYLREKNVWEKDTENKDGLKKAVKLIAHKNMLKVSDWKEAYPQYKDASSKKNDQYLKILVGSAGPYNQEDDLWYDKIIRNVAKEVTIDKQL